MTESVKNKAGFFKDKGKWLETSKELRGRLGAAVYTRAPQFFTHFTDRTAVATNFTATETGSGTSKAAFALSTSVVGGAAVGVAGATTNNAEEMGGIAVIWKVNSDQTRPLVFEARVKVVGTSTATDGQFCLGLADAVTYTSGLPFVLSTASAFTTHAPVEFAGFLYSSNCTSGDFYLPGGNPVNVVSIENSAAPVDVVTSVVKDSLFHIYRVELDPTGAASYFIDDAHVGSIDDAVTETVALTPYFNVVGLNSHANTMTVDYVLVASATSL